MKRVLNTIKTIRQEIRNVSNTGNNLQISSLTKEEQKILLEIEEKGFYVIPNFYSEIECTEIRKEIDTLLEKYKNQVVIDNAYSDHRVWGADRVSSLISKFFTNPFINKIIRAHQKTDSIVGFTLAAKLEYKTNNLGSGAGWHRDTAHSKQIKSILYLSDVDNSSGPFQYIKNSHGSLHVIKDTALGNFSFNQNRFEPEEIKRLIGKDKSRIETFLGKAGTLILVNTRGLHRGSPIEKGARYALTNYFFENEIPKHLEEMTVKN